MTSLQWLIVSFIRFFVFLLLPGDLGSAKFLGFARRFNGLQGLQSSELLIAGDPISLCLRVSLVGISIVGAQCFLGDSSLGYFP